MILRRTDEGALKCALRDLRREEETSVKYDDDKYHLSIHPSYSLPIQRIVGQETAISYRKWIDVTTA